MNSIRAVCVAAGAGRQIHSASRFQSPSPLFALPQLSASRESQYLSKGKGIPRSEFSPALQLIRSSEVDNLPYEKSAQLSSRGMATMAMPFPPNITALPFKIEDVQAISIGRALLNEHQRVVAGLRTELDSIRVSFDQVRSRAESAQSKAFVLGAIALIVSWWAYHESQAPTVTPPELSLKEKLRHHFDKGKLSSFNGDMQRHWASPAEPLTVAAEDAAQGVAQATSAAESIVLAGTEQVKTAVAAPAKSFKGLFWA